MESILFPPGLLLSDYLREENRKDRDDPCAGIIRIRFHGSRSFLDLLSAAQYSSPCQFSPGL